MAQNPWDVIWPSEPDDKAETVYLSVGKALSDWESLEHQLATYFAFFATNGADDDVAARRAYGSAIAFRARFEMIQAAAEVYFLNLSDADLSVRFYDLINEIAKFSPRRNEIAHGIVRSMRMPMESSEAEEKLRTRALTPEDFGYALFPSEYSTNKNTLVVRARHESPRQNPRYLYSSKEIDGYGRHFRRLGKAAKELMLDWGDNCPESFPLPRF